MASVWIRFALAALLLYFATEAVSGIPMLQTFLRNQAIGRLVLYLATLAVAGLLLWYLPQLRMLHELNLVRKAADFIWPDIILTALALAHMSRLWPKVFEWIDRQSA